MNDREISRLVAAWIEAERNMTAAYRQAQDSMRVAVAARSALATAIMPHDPQPGMHRVVTCGAFTVDALVAEDLSLTLELCYPEPPPSGAPRNRLRIVQ